MRKVFISRPLQQPAIDVVSRNCEVHVHQADGELSETDLAEALRDVDGAMPCGQPVTSAAIAGATRLRVIANIGVGYDNIDLDACRAHHIIVTNTPDVLTEATADLGFALILAAGRRVVEGDRYVREGRWGSWQWNFLWGAEMHAKTLGLYGFGRIGRAMARRARGFGMQVLYNCRHRLPESVETAFGARFVDKGTLFRESDFLSVHVPSTVETRHSIAESELSLMKPTAYIINTARGNIINEEDLVQALLSGRVAGAGLDVFEHEPNVHPALLSMNNVVLMPHAGSATSETRLRMSLLAVENLLTAFRGERPPNLVNLQV